MSETTYQTTRASSGSPVTAVLGATAAAVAIWIVATLAGADLTVSFGPGQPIQKVTVINVVVAALVGSLAGWIARPAPPVHYQRPCNLDRHRDPLRPVVPRRPAVDDLVDWHQGG